MANPEEAYEEIISDVGDIKLDLTKDEKLRATALILAIKYHSDTICRDAAMYRELIHDNKHLTPSTVEGVIRSAQEFEKYLLGQSSVIKSVEVLEDDTSQPLRPQTDEV